MGNCQPLFLFKVWKVKQMINDFDGFVDKLERRLRQPLPGMEAQVKMAPQPLDLQRFREPVANSAKPGGVMVLLYPHANDVYLPLMKRTDYKGAHSGQVSFPGGKYEPGDRDLVHTALRETEEEIGVKIPDIKVIGSLSELFIIVSNFKVFPVIGVAREQPAFVPDPQEVKEVINVSLSQLNDPAKKGVKKMKVGTGAVIQSPYFDVEGHVVWGATAMMLSELLEVVNPLVKELQC